MRRQCEICACSQSESGERHPRNVAGGTVRRLLIDGRIVALCDRHAQALLASESQSLRAVRELFPESEGRRSLLPRRSPLDRRVFPPRPEGRRQTDGRRSTDPLD